MTEQEKAKKLLPIIQAIAEGKKIQFSFNGETWFDRDKNLELQTICDDIISDSTDYRIKPEENYTIEQNAGENRVEGGVISVSGSVNKEDDELWYVILNMNMQYEICRKCPKSGLFSGTHEECEKWILDKWNEEHPKQEKRYRPFKSCDELIEFYTHKHYISENLKTGAMPVIWVTNKQTGCRELIMGYGVSAIKLVSATLDMNELYEKYTFLDGSDCGVADDL